MTLMLSAPLPFRRHRRTHSAPPLGDGTEHGALTRKVPFNCFGSDIPLREIPVAPEPLR